MTFTSPETLQAADWWATLVNEDHAALYDPYGGSQTGVPGDPFIAGKAAMGYNGFFAVGQLNEAGGIDYDVVQPLIGIDGQRYTPRAKPVCLRTFHHGQRRWIAGRGLDGPQRHHPRHNQ